MQAYNYRVVIVPDADGGYYAYVPLLRGVHSQGESFEEVRSNIKEAIICHVQGLRKDRLVIPSEPGAVESVELVTESDLQPVK